MSVTSSTSPHDRDAIWHPIRRFTVEEYHRMGQAGVLTEDDRVELLEGFIVAKMNRKPIHDAIVDLVREVVEPRLQSGWRIRVQSAITTSDSEPEPDLAVVRGGARDYLTSHPGPADVALIIEVADTSVARDRAKQRLYARAGVPHYWIVNLVDKQLEVFCQPLPSNDDPRFQTAEILADLDTVPLIIAGQTMDQIRIADLLP